MESHTFYQLSENQTFYATYKQLVDVTDIETINFYNNTMSTGGRYEVKYRLRLVDKPRASTAVKEVIGSQYSSSGGVVSAVNLSLDVSKITR